MRFNPATETTARSIDDIAAECRQAIQDRQAEPRVSVRWASRQAFAADSCRTWALCRDIATMRNDRATVARMEYNLDRDMAIAINHRPWQPEY